MKALVLLVAGLALAGVESPVHGADRVVLVVGTGVKEPLGAPSLEVKLKEPFGVAFNREGELFIIEMALGNRLLKRDRNGKIFQLAGGGPSEWAGDGGPMKGARFNGPHNLAISPDGVILISDTWNGRIRRLDPNLDVVATLAGFVAPLESARESGPYCVTLDPAGTLLYIADLRRVHLLDLRTGKARVVAGNGEKGPPKDGALATEAPLVDPRAAAADKQGNVYILERGGHALRVVDSQGRIRTVVNARGLKGSSGDGGPAFEATLNGPKHLCVDANDDVIIADAENHLIRKFIPKEGRIQRVAGTGRQGSAGLGGPPEQAELARPHGVTIGPDGLLYITDTYNHRILRIER